MGKAVQVLDGTAKSPVVVMFEITRGLVPVLEIVTVCGALVPFTPSLPKGSDVGEADAPTVTVVFSL